MSPIPLLLLGGGALAALVAVASRRPAPASASPPALPPAAPNSVLMNDFLARLEPWLASRPSPEQIEEVAEQLETRGWHSSAVTLRLIAAERRAEAAQSSSAPAAIAPAQPLPSAPAPAIPPPPPRERETSAPAAGATSDDLLEGELARLDAASREEFGRAMRVASASDLRRFAPELRARGYPRLADAFEQRAAYLERSAVSPPPPGSAAPASSSMSADLPPASPATDVSPSRSTTASPAPPASPAAAPAPPAAEPPRRTDHRAPAPSSTSEPSRPDAEARRQNVNAPGGAGVDLALARRLAPQMGAEIARQGFVYSRQKLQRFQRAAGLQADGLYGGTTRGALVYFGVRNAPAPLFAPRETVSYQPPGRA
ncbi:MULTISPECIES: peptidoglycan-binding domain-containing protein [Sandaracinus]|uniref:peptidoglycan-binding domain-containing protein n=1 Tax=Sandaracinus TaxID=1055688 RepID=UPI0019D49DD0|nr:MULTISPECIES: peptidoglycan-binding domain-containing protein [Sandaracinus]UJR87307.1 Hypothetical protein I5071_990 [Sandaracinus amylolyticus]